MITKIVNGWLLLRLQRIDPRAPHKSIVQQTNCACQRGLKIQMTPERLSEFVYNTYHRPRRSWHTALKRGYWPSILTRGGSDFVFSMIGAGLDSSASGDGINGGIRGTSWRGVSKGCSAVLLDGATWVWCSGEAAEWPWLMRVFRRNHERWNENHFGGL